MNTKRKICVVTGTRAEYGLLQPIMKAIKEDKLLELQVAVTGMHLSPEFGLTYKTIEEDDFEISEKIEILLSSDTSIGVAKAIGLATISFSETLNRLKPDFIMILGDRFELLAAAQAALVSRIPIVHIAGGDVTEGAFDEAIRHSITKMSQLHFVTNKESEKRVHQLGEDPESIHLVGNPGLDHLNSLKLMGKNELEKSLRYSFKSKNILVTFHSVTLDNAPSVNSFSALLEALDGLGEDIGIIFTRPNADTEGRQLIKMLDKYVEDRSNCIVYTSLGQLRYLSTVALVDVVVGNSSSGILEAPSLKTATVNIGDRQKGRLRADSIIDCEPITENIKESIQQAFKLDCSTVVNPYGDGNTTERVLKVLREINHPERLIKKHFYDIDFEYS
jgi:UDP-N-acetylglucosamine 2-epimerase (non-hydrolysing)/GDP/UDP-N,N'-diacetylbacillosamine 2-epimerase (hydrolysing)